MAGYDDTYNMIISTLMGRPNGTEIQPENHQAFALNMLEYIRSLELLANAPFIGVATPTTQPVQPDDSRACYIAGVAQDRTTVFQNFYDVNGEPISITNGEMEACLVIMVWNGQYWSAESVPTNIISSADQAYFFYNLIIRKTYDSVADMNEDVTAPIGNDGRYIHGTFFLFFVRKATARAAPPCATIAPVMMALNISRPVEDKSSISKALNT